MPVSLLSAPIPPLSHSCLPITRSPPLSALSSQLLSSLPAINLSSLFTISRPHAHAHAAAQEVPIDL
ncbi:Fatty acid synthase subunit beta [Fusarium oxysporum f. sp. albedinis]|nr:Fatty acid synthase subunit beta [Fusarium oxysporum f. sp. albedinis]